MLRPDIQSENITRPIANMSDSTVLPPDNNRGPEILAICGTAVGIALAVVALRIWVRVKIIGKMGRDDYFKIAAMVGDVPHTPD